jgi:hypothetical protein
MELPPIWLGASFTAWLKVLRGHAVSPRNLPLAAMISAASMVNSSLGVLQSLVFGLQIGRTRLDLAPIFVIGHWRTGTTLLHELLALDQNHTFPNNYTCFAPHHFLLTERLFGHAFDWLLPAVRPMDGVPIKYDSPQEDEFALCNLGASSPYRAITFPASNSSCAAMVDQEEHTFEARQKWIRTYLWFLRALTYREPKRLVLKSPVHMFRVPRLLELFPNARLVHIVREPLATVVSTIAMWTTLYRSQALQPFDRLSLPKRVIENYLAAYAHLDSSRSLMRAGQFHELRYEDLVHDPVLQMNRLYSALDLGEFPLVTPQAISFLHWMKQYRQRSYEVSDEDRDSIRKDCAMIAQRYGYST